MKQRHARAGGGGRAAEARGRPGDRARPGPIVAVLEKHGRFLTATPFFTRGPRMNVDRGAARPGELVLVAPTGRGAGHGKVQRRIGRPDVARDVLEALMLDRGLRRRFDPLAEREAREAGFAGARGAAGRPARAAHVHDRPAPRARLRRRDLGRAARRRRRARVGPHRRRERRTCARTRTSIARRFGARPPSTCRDWSSRCSPRRSPTERARSCRTRSAWRSPSSSTSTGTG